MKITSEELWNWLLNRIIEIKYKNIRYRCKRCGRDKFQKPIPHKCGNIFLKHYGRKKYKEKYNGSIWEKVK